VSNKQCPCDVAVCCSVLQCVAVCCSVLQCAAVCCSVLQCVAVCCRVLQCGAVCCSVLPCVAVCCSVLQCVAVCCGVLQCAAVCSWLMAHENAHIAPGDRNPTPNQYCNTLQHTATHCNILQHTATHMWLQGTEHRHQTKTALDAGRHSQTPAQYLFYVSNLAAGRFSRIETIFFF